MASWVASVGPITLFQEDLQVARAFYLRVFERPIHFEDDASVVFAFGTTLVNLLDRGAASELVEPGVVGSRENGPRIVLTLPVDDVDRVCQQLAEAGVQLSNGPMNRPWGIRTASFEDPSGHIWEVAGPVLE